MTNETTWNVAKKSELFDKIWTSEFWDRRTDRRPQKRHQLLNGSSDWLQISTECAWVHIHFCLLDVGLLVNFLVPSQTWNSLACYGPSEIKLHKVPWMENGDIIRILALHEIRGTQQLAVYPKKFPCRIMYFKHTHIRAHTFVHRLLQRILILSKRYGTYEFMTDRLEKRSSYPAKARFQI